MLNKWQQIFLFHDPSGVYATFITPYKLVGLYLSVCPYTQTIKFSGQELFLTQFCIPRTQHEDRHLVGIEKMNII